MDFNKLFKAAKENGITEFSINIRYHKSFSLVINNDQINKCQGSESNRYLFKGKYKQKIGGYSSENYSEDDNNLVIKTIIENASLKDEDEEVFFFNDQKKVSNILKQPDNDLNKKIKELSNIHEKLTSYSPLVKNTFISYYYNYSRIRVINSLGLDKEDSSYGYNTYLFVTAEKKTKKDSLVKDAYYHYEDINDKKLTETRIFEVADQAINKLNSVSADKDKYKIILGDNAAKAIFAKFMVSFFAEKVQKDESLFKDKLNQLIASNKLSIIEDPTNINTPCKRLFDDEGVNTYQKELITNGKLNMFLYNLKSAAKDKVKSTGNGFKGTGYANMYVKPSNILFQELVKSVNNGIFVEEVTSLHSGVNLISGSISCKASGYLIENGKVTKSLETFILNTDFESLLKNIEEVGSDLNESGNFKSPSLIISEVDITF